MPNKSPFCRFPGGFSKPPNVGTKTIEENGTYAALDDGYDGYSAVTVDVVETGVNPKVGGDITDVANDYVAVTYSYSIA